jgi:hypothetical protein
MRRFLPLGLPMFYIRPDADDTDGAWTSTATHLYEVIDETSLSDADYIESSANPVNDLCKIRLSNPSVTPAMPFTVKYRGFKTVATGTMELRARLLQGTTQIASWTESNVPATPTTYSHTLSQGEFDSITDFTDLFIELRANYT